MYTNVPNQMQVHTSVQKPRTLRKKTSHTYSKVPNTTNFNRLLFFNMHECYKPAPASHKRKPRSLQTSANWNHFNYLAQKLQHKNETTNTSMIGESVTKLAIVVLKTIRTNKHETTEGNKVLFWSTKNLLQTKKKKTVKDKWKNASGFNQGTSNACSLWFSWRKSIMCEKNAFFGATFLRPKNFDPWHFLEVKISTALVTCGVKTQWTVKTINRIQ